MSNFMGLEAQLLWFEKPDFQSGIIISLLSIILIFFSDVSDITKAPEILGGRVKTLHPSVHGGMNPFSLCLADN
jgi:hypothetical protein